MNRRARGATSLCIPTADRMKLARIHHINKCPGGYLVRIRRATLQRQAWRMTLKAAIAIRDEFLAGLPIELPRPSFATKAHSNTGHAGICETYSRKGRKKYPAFCRPKRCVGASR